MKLKPLTIEERGQAIAESFVGVTGRVLELRAAGAAVTDERRAALLASAVAREAVELEVDILAYEQQPGVRNRNSFRFRDGAMVKLGGSGVGTPFLRDHDRYSVDAIGGEVIASKTKKLGDGHYEIHQTVKLTEPAAVERALRGNLKAVSIGAFPTGPVLCLVCGTPVFEACWHYRGQEVDVDGQTVVVEWEYQEAELVETSEVPIGAVPRAGVQTIRAALAAAGNGVSNSGDVPPTHEEKTMKNRAAIVAKLKLAGLLAACANPAEPTDVEIEAGLDELLGDRAELAVVAREAVANHQTAEDKFVRAALDTGRILANEADTWRDFFRASPQRAQERMAKRPANCATPVGAAAQRTAPEPTEAQVKAAGVTAAEAAGVPTVEGAARDSAAKAVLAANGVDHAKAVKFAKAFGAKDPKAAIAKHAAGVEV